MKKGIYFGVLFLFFIGCVFAYSGVSPSSYEIDFEPNFKNNYLFNFFFSEGTDSEIFVEGDLSEYVFVDKKGLKGSGVVIASVKLPEVIEVPGVHMVYIRARELQSVVSGVGISLSVGGVLKIRVPYPGKYAELNLNVESVNVGEDVNIDLDVFSRGDEDIFSKVTFEIRDFSGRLIESLNGGEELVESTKSKHFSTVLDSSSYLAGDYNISSIVEYGGESSAIASKIFRLGELRVDVLNHTRFLEKNKINRFEIEIESFWNGEIDGVYAEIIIPETGESFKTPSISLGPWKKTILTGFLDTSFVKGDYFDAEIILSYGNKTTSKVVRVELLKRVSYFLIIVIVGIILAVLLFALVAIYIKKNFKIVKNGKKR